MLHNRHPTLPSRIGAWMFVYRTWSRCDSPSVFAGLRLLPQPKPSWSSWLQTKVNLPLAGGSRDFSFCTFVLRNGRACLSLCVTPSCKLFFVKSSWIWLDARRIGDEFSGSPLVALVCVIFWCGRVDACFWGFFFEKFLTNSAKSNEVCPARVLSKVTNGLFRHVTAVGLSFWGYVIVNAKCGLRLDEFGLREKVKFHRI